MEALIIMVLALIAIAAATTLGPRLGVASPLILVLLGIGISFLPFVPAVHIEPEWILAGVLPPLLYSASVSMPAMDFRREFTAIGGLSVLLVVVSAVVLGLFFAWCVPGLGFGWGLALGAIVSPTDAVATSIVKKAGVSGRVVSILEGESLLNDASALVLLRAAVAAAGASISLWGVVGNFAYSVVVAIVFGVIVGRLNLVVRARVTDPTVNTVLSFTVPFLASIPAEALGASGLVAAVVAGLVTGRRAPRVLSPEHRLSDMQNWRTVELVLEGIVFLVMGLELFGIVVDVQRDHAGLGQAAVIAAGALLLTVLVRAAYVAPLLAGLSRRAMRRERMRPRIVQMREKLEDPEEAQRMLARGGPGRRRSLSAADLGRAATRVRRALADLDYLMAAPLGWREGTTVVWAGMRGAVTVAAAQTLPDTPDRSLLVLIAFLVAAASLLVQGGTLRPLVNMVKPAKADPAAERDERVRLMTLLKDAAATVPVSRDDRRDAAGFAAAKRARLSTIRAQREALLDARDEGAFSADTLERALLNLDADEISIRLKGGPVGDADAGRDTGDGRSDGDGSGGAEGPVGPRDSGRAGDADVPGDADSAGSER